MPEGSYVYIHRTKPRKQSAKCKLETVAPSDLLLKILYRIQIDSTDIGITHFYLFAEALRVFQFKI